MSRISRLLLVYAVILCALAQTLSSQAYLAWTGAALVTVPSALSVPVFLIARLLGWRFDRINSLGSGRPANDQTRITLKQLMFLTATGALLSIGLRTLLPGIGGILQRQWTIWQAASITASGLVAFFLATSKHKRLHAIGASIAMIFVALLVLEPVAFSIYGYSMYPSGWYLYGTGVRHFLGFCATVFLASSVLDSAQGFHLHPFSSSVKQLR